MLLDNKNDNFRVWGNDAEKRAMQEMARKGGQSRSARKKASSRRNGRLGGRPRKPLTPEQIRPI